MFWVKFWSFYVFSDFTNKESWFSKNTNGIAATLLIVEKIQDSLDSKNISLAVAYLPTAKEIYYSDWAEELKVKIFPGLSAGAVLKPHIQELGLTFIDLTPTLRRVRKSEAPLYLPLDVHPSETGHKIIAEHINKFLKNLKID